MKKFTTIAAICAIAFAAQNAYAKTSKEKKSEDAQESWYNDLERDFAVEMETMEKQMKKTFDEQKKLMNKVFEASKKDIGSGQSVSSLRSYKTDDFYRYELTFADFGKDEVSVTVAERILAISANHQKADVKDAKKQKETFQANSFYYSVPLPVDAASALEIFREKGRIVMSFARVRD